MEQLFREIGYGLYYAFKLILVNFPDALFRWLAAQDFVKAFMGLFGWRQIIIAQKLTPDNGASR